MNQELWSKILAFDLDDPPSEYGFSTRLANENYWTKAFTELAFLEYKKFMYLAATSDLMVSPSEIVDTVWHQHLIFTQSYQEFCELLGKQIQHIPSTHNREDFQKFRQAKERTSRFYEREFGEQPKSIWNYGSMFDSLHLEKARLKIRTFLVIGILAFLCLTVPAYFLLNPLYAEIDNPYFIVGFIALALAVLLGLEFYNRSKLKAIVSQFDQTSFIYDLQPFELVYLKTQKLSHVINGTVNELVDKGIIHVNPDYTIELLRTGATLGREQLQATASLSELGRTFYPNLLMVLAAKPIFWNVANSMSAFRKYFHKSKKFGSLFYINFTVLLLVFLLAFTRIVTGIQRDRPEGYIVVATIFFGIITGVFLHRLTNQVCTTTIPDLYKEELLPQRQVEMNWQWRYFLLGAAVLTTSFVPLANYIDKNTSGGGGNSCGTSCGSSCGSSCSSCGGCGGD